jgi:hypothetical protein
MDSTELIAQHAKTVIAGSAVYLGFTLSEWAAIFGIIFAIINTIAILPATVKAVREGWQKWRSNGSK